ncbi:unnamed protein product [Moneuplotes crassus]|uniref:Uncharacterized protein n=1 Tax=Euplotes crassus TaxID=5936 RepID=A0AAD1XC87_EUPCR|nr:unnamed protein product [Moneuplotes crassus]
MYYIRLVPVLFWEMDCVGGDTVCDPILKDCGGRETYLETCSYLVENNWEELKDDRLERLMEGED